jgi:hypothetical protein
MTTPPMRPPRGLGRLPCGTDLGALVAQVADGVEGDRAHQAGCPWCQGALAELERLWALVGELAAERVEAPDRIDALVLGRIQRAILVGRVTELFGSLLPRLGWALLTYTGLAGGGRGVGP